MNTTFQKLSGIANTNGFTDMVQTYTAVTEKIYADSMRRYAVLGDTNSGKSLVLNALTGRQAAPVSLLSGKHDKVLFIDCPERGCIFAELATDTYCGADAVNSSLWNIDAAAYIISALTPMTSNDIAAIRACISVGIPVTLVLNKLNMVDEDDVEMTLGAVKNQIFSLFRSEELIIFDRTNPATGVEKIMNALEGSEDSREVREYAVTVEFAKALEKAIGARYDEAKTRYEELTIDETDHEDENLFWESLAAELDKRKLALIHKLDGQAHRQYADCIKTLNAKMQKSSDPELWWKRMLPREMKAENDKIANNMGRAAEDSFLEDRRWLSIVVSKKYGVEIRVEDIDRNLTPFDSLPQNVSGRLQEIGGRRKMAFTGLAASAAVLAGGLLLPFTTVATIVTCSIAGVAAVGTGFWAFLETQNAAEEKDALLHRELDKYVSQCRDTVIENTKNYINYCYENLVVAAKDAQMFKMSESLKPTAEQSDALKRLTVVSEDKKLIDGIMSRLLLTEE